MSNAAVKKMEISTMNLKDQKLFRQQAYINGQWVGADSGKTIDVNNPATGEILGTVPNLGGAETKRAIEAAQAAWESGRSMLASERSKILRKWAELQTEHLDDLCRILTTEQGKPLSQAKAEIVSGINYVEWMAEEGKRVYGDMVPAFKPGTRVLVNKEPIGVVGAITPWNFPSAMITRKVAPALAAGCTVVLKPAEDTPLSALALAVLAEQAGFPPGILNIVTGSLSAAPQIGKVLTTHPDVRKISFTGSTEVGKLLMRQSADTVKKVSLELGGNAPFIVFESADLDKAADGAMICKYRNAGQTCVCANRIYVQDSIYDAFAEKMAARVTALKVGPGDQEGVQVGPLINGQGIEKVKQHIADATAKGAKLLCGGKPHEAGPLFFAPTLLRDMTPSMMIKSEETFGPVGGLFRFKTEEEALHEANDTRYGLASYFFSRDMAQCFRVAETLEYGLVGVNEAIMSTEVAPFGGYKESGIGREGSKYGIDDYIELKYILLGGLSRRKNDGSHPGPVASEYSSRVRRL